MFREYTREQYLERIAWMKAARNARSALPPTSSSASRARPRQSSSETLSLLDEVGYDGVFAFKYSPRPNTPALQYADSIPEEEKSRRLAGAAGASARDPAGRAISGI